MVFHLEHPDFKQYGFYLMGFTPEIEKDVNRLCPVEFITGTYDWPKWYKGFRGWADSVNSLWWPSDADNFATAVLLIDDARNDLINKTVSALRAKISIPSPGLNKPADWRFPWVILSARLSPPERGEPGEAFPPSGVGPVDKETPLIEWKMYPLASINVTSLDPSEKFRGLWLLPLVDIRYYYRNVPLNSVNISSSSSGCTDHGYPLIRMDRDKSPTWMPPLLAYPQDKFPPANYVAISGNGTSPSVDGATLWGDAADTQAKMENWRVVCRDVRSKYNVPVTPLNTRLHTPNFQGGDIEVGKLKPSKKLPHDEFTGVISDYPENFDMPTDDLIEGYHIDACKFIDAFQSRLAGGLCDVRMLDEFIARKLQFVFQVDKDDYFYSVTIGSLVDYPVNTTQLGEDTDGPDEEERKIIPGVFLGKQSPTRTPTAAEHTDLVIAAKQWALLYFLWKRKQSFFKFPGIFPLIPNGHAKVIRWDFQTDPDSKEDDLKLKCETTYVALEGVQGTTQDFCAKREPFFARIDGEGSLDDHLQGYYAWTKLLDKDGQLIDYPNPRKGYVAGVNGQFVSVNPGRDDAGKVAVPVGLIVYMKPGVPYLDVYTCTIFDHFRFTTSDLLQVVKLKPVMETNKYGHVGAIIRRWNPDIVGFVDSSEIWSVLLD